MNELQKHVLNKARPVARQIASLLERHLLTHHQDPLEFRDFTALGGRFVRQGWDQEHNMVFRYNDRARIEFHNCRVAEGTEITCEASQPRVLSQEAKRPAALYFGNDTKEKITRMHQMTQDPYGYPSRWESKEVQDAFVAMVSEKLGSLIMQGEHHDYWNDLLTAYQKAIWQERLAPSDDLGQYEIPISPGRTLEIRRAYDVTAKEQWLTFRAQLDWDVRICQTSDGDLLWPGGLAGYVALLKGLHTGKVPDKDKTVQKRARWYAGTYKKHPVDQEALEPILMPVRAEIQVRDTWTEASDIRYDVVERET